MLINCMTSHAGLDRNQPKPCFIIPFCFSWPVVALFLKTPNYFRLKTFVNSKNTDVGASLIIFVYFVYLFPIGFSRKSNLSFMWALIRSVCLFGSQDGWCTGTVDDCVQTSSCWKDINVDCNLGLSIYIRLPWPCHFLAEEMETFFT